MKPTQSLPLAAALLCFCLSASITRAFNIETHETMNDEAVSNSNLGSFLQTEVGFLRGVNERFSAKSVNEWINEGGKLEDDSRRPLNHFHDPLVSDWTNAGLGHGLGLPSLPFIPQSSVVWMQEPQGWSWQETRDFYHTALTARAPGTRSAAWAKTFRALGQVMHLVEDAGQPAHVRNDQHLGGVACEKAGLSCFGNFEYWASDLKNASNLRFAGQPPFDRGILKQPTGHSEAPVPIARLIDTDRYNGSNVGITLNTGIGLGEFTNANFFSEDTVNNDVYLFPSVASAALLQVTGTDPETGLPRLYYKKAEGYGYPVDPLATVGIFDDGVGPPELVPAGVDATVWQASADILVPRATDYAQGVIEYFTRGTIEIIPPAQYVYGRAPAVGASGNDGAFTHLSMQIRNATADEEMGEGKVTAVVRYRTGLGYDLIEHPSTELSVPYYAVSDPITMPVTREFTPVEFNFTESPIPTNSADQLLMIVYRGPLTTSQGGVEQDAVVVSSKELYGPDPIDIINSTDWDCYGGLHYVADLTAFPPWDGEHFERDLDDPKDFRQDLFGPYLEYGPIMTKVSALSDPNPCALANGFDYELPALGPCPGGAARCDAEYSRYFVLQDQPAYTVTWVTPAVVDVGTPAQPAFPDCQVVQVPANFNRQVCAPEDGPQCHVWRLNPLLARGVPMLKPVFYVNEPPRFSACLADLPAQEPALTRIDGCVAEDCP